MPHAICRFKCLLILLILSSCLPKEETQQDKINKIDALDKEWSTKQLRREMKVEIAGPLNNTYDTVFVLSYFDKDNNMRYRINCATFDSSVDVIFIHKNDEVVKRTMYKPYLDSFQVIHLLDSNNIYSQTAKHLNTDAVGFLSQEDRTLINRMLNLRRY